MSASDWTPDIVIRPGQQSAWSELAEVWDHRELLANLVRREIQGRYRRTTLGVAWLLVRPALNMVVFAFVFGVVLKVASDGLPYPLFLLAGMAPWSFFYNAVTRAATSLADNEHVISKVYFPRLALPLASVMSGVADLAASALVLVALMIVYQTPLRFSMLWLPVFLAAALLPALAAGVWLAALTVRYRDLTYALNFLLQTLMYATPVVYPVSLVPERWQPLYWLNPMVGVIQGTRWALLGSSAPPGGLFLVSLGLTVLVLASGAYRFQRTVRSIVDVL